MGDLFSNLQRDGIAVVEDFFPKEALAQARDYVQNQLATRGGEYFSLINVDQLPGSPFGRIIEESGLNRVLSGLVREALPQAADDEIYNVLRVLVGKTGLGQAHCYHYDATVITGLMPLFIPEGEPGTAGDLIVFPNSRPLRRWVLVNLLEKALLQNKLASLILRKESVRRLLGGKRIRLKPGNLYLFWGYRTLHGNEPCDTHQLRATALFHLGNPHRDSIATALILKLRRFREERILRKRGVAPAE